MRVPPELHDSILARAVRGDSPQKIADWLLAEHQVKVSRQAIAKIVKRRTSDTAATAALAESEHVREHMPNWLDQLATIRSTNRALLIDAQAAYREKRSEANAKLVKWFTDMVERSAEAERKMLGPREDPESLAGNISELLARGFEKK